MLKCSKELKESAEFSAQVNHIAFFTINEDEFVTFHETNLLCCNVNMQHAK